MSYIMKNHENRTSQNHQGASICIRNAFYAYYIIQGYYRSYPGSILGTLFFRDFHGPVQVVRYSKGSRWIPDLGLIPSERAPTTMAPAVEFVLFHGFHVEISWVKGGPGPSSGGWGPGQSGAPW